MKRLGRDAAELTAPADHLTAHGLVLEMLAGPLPGSYDPSGPGRMLFEQIRPDLIIPAGRRTGRNPGLAGIYRALAEHEKAQGYPEAVAQAHADFAELRKTPKQAGSPFLETERE
ncbi:hypothetical protein [Streptomyces sp. Ag109_G2-15]|uniref:hypothetical protein n=1 Tax=Streptomyces sp. Ag109_G2-15 TaxID=1938850 RepID=UPI00211BDE35|nr:hypothetical protein [Streptomyces sp. Ag109_G2-15]